MTPVRGHFCPGLDRLHAASGLGTPGIREDGRLGGWDGDNPYPISYCPFCGVKLRPLTEEERHHPYTCATTYGEPCDCEWYAISEGVS